MKTLSKEALKKSLLDKWSPITGTHHMPFTIVRTTDDSILLLNDDYETYSFDTEYNMKYHRCHRYTYERLFHDYRINDHDFNVTAWAPIDNLVNFPEKYFTKPFQKTELDER